MRKPHMTEKRKMMEKEGVKTSKTVAVRSRATPARTERPPVPMRPTGNRDQLIRERAYQIFLRRRGGPGNATADWAQAERELRAEGKI
jgi:hypothetical protein